MAIILQCTSGHRMSVAEEYQGKRVRCPQCGEVVAVAAAAEVPLDLGLPAPKPPEEAARHVQSSLPPPVAERDEAYDAPARAPRGGRDEWDERRDRDYDRRDFDRRDFDRRDFRDRDRRSEMFGGVDEATQLQSVSFGLLFRAVRYFMWIFMLLLGGGVLTIGLMVDLMRPIRGRDAEVWHVLMGIMAVTGVLLLIVMLVFTFIGSAMCCRAPARSGARGLILGSLLCDGLVIFFAILILFLAIMASGPGRGGDALGIFAGFCFIVALMCAIAGQILAHVFYYKMAQYAQAPRTGTNVIINMVLWLVGVVGGAVAIVGALALLHGSRARNETVGMVMLIVCWSICVLMVLVYGFLIGSISALRRRIAAEMQGSMA